MNAPVDSAYGLWYYPCINRFVDEDGHILHNLVDLFDVWQLEEWKQTGEYGVLIDHKGDLCELYYATPEDDKILFEALKIVAESAQLDARYKQMTVS